MRSRRAWHRLPLARTLLDSALCLHVALLARWSFDRPTGRSTPWVSLVALGLAGTTFAILTRHSSVEARVDEAHTPRPTAISSGVVAATPATSVLGCLDFGTNRFRPAGGLLLTLPYLWLIPARPRATRMQAGEELG